jgi:hypothetical protein
MAKRAKGVDSGGSVEGAIGGFAEDLGRILGQARNKAEGWLGQRQAIVKQLTQLRDEATNLLNQLGQQAAVAGRRGRRAANAMVAAVQKRGPGRPAGSKNKGRPWRGLGHSLDEGELSFVDAHPEPGSISVGCRESKCLACVSVSAIRMTTFG